MKLKIVIGKGDARYWLQSGKLLRDARSRFLVCKIQVNGRRESFPLRTSNKAAAAEKAARIYHDVIALGWEPALAKHKPEPQRENAKGATVGKLIEIASSVSTARRHTLDAYVKAFRRIVSEVIGVQDGRKFDAFKGGTKEWREKVDAVELSRLSPTDIQAWKNRRLRNSEGDPLAKRRAIVTVNSLIRNAKSLFGKKVLPFVEQKLSLSRPLPFDGVMLEKGPSLRYVSKIDAYAILATARDELANSDPEAFKALILALVCGLRRSEIDHLLWRNFNFARRVLMIENSEYHQLKSEDSAGEIDLDADTCALFQGFRAQSPSDRFVIKSPNPPQSEKQSRSYRCNVVFQRANAWLRSQGVENIKPLHTMRKEIGSIIASEHGIFEASRYLRHSDIRITSAFYADKKKTVTPKIFSGLLSSGDSVIEFQKPDGSRFEGAPLQTTRSGASR